MDGDAGLIRDRAVGPAAGPVPGAPNLADLPPGALPPGPPMAAPQPGILRTCRSWLARRRALRWLAGRPALRWLTRRPLQRWLAQRRVLWPLGVTAVIAAAAAAWAVQAWGTV